MELGFDECAAGSGDSPFYRGIIFAGVIRIATDIEMTNVGRRVLCADSYWVN